MDTVAILDRLVSFETLTGHTNLDMVDYIEASCSGLGGTCTRIMNPAGDKSGFIVQFGPDEPGGIVLSGHCDVVPVEGQPWTRPAFRLTREGDRLFGRGTTDMKGFLACMLQAAQAASKMTLARPLTLIFSYDEEIGCVGIQEMRPKLPSLLASTRLCIVGEPTEMQVAIGHKGKAALRATFKGEAGHSALAPKFVNALYMASDFISALRQLQDHYARNGARDPGYDIPYSTFHVGTLSGGTALNIIPEKAQMTFEYRFMPADGDAALFEAVEEIARSVAAPYRARVDAAAIAVKRYNSYPGLDTDPSSDAALLAQRVANGATLTKVAFGTEAGVLAEMGVPVIVCGPGSMEAQGHKPDEYIDLTELNACTAMLDNALATLQ